MRLRLFTPGKLSKYPHIYGADAELLNKFWEVESFNFNSVAYDIPIGGFLPYEKQHHDLYNRNWEYLSSLKIDMVGFKDDSTWIIEFKHISKFEALGQLLTYQYIVEKYNLLKRPYELLFVSFHIRPYLKEVLQKFNIRYMECS